MRLYSFYHKPANSWLCPFSCYSEHCAASTVERGCAGEGGSHLGGCPVNPALCTWINVNKNESLHQVGVAELWGESTDMLRGWFSPCLGQWRARQLGSCLQKEDSKRKPERGAPCVPGSQRPLQSLAQRWLPARPYPFPRWH